MEELRVGSISEYRERSRANKLRDKENKGMTKELFAMKAVAYVPPHNHPPAGGGNKNGGTTSTSSTSNPTAVPVPVSEGGPGLGGPSGSGPAATTDQQRDSHLSAGAAAKAVLATVLLADGVPFKVHPCHIPSFCSSPSHPTVIAPPLS